MNLKDSVLDFYRTQSFYTDPGRYSYLFDNLPSDKTSLRRIVEGIRINYVTDEFVLGYKAPPERLRELDSRNMETMLAEVLRLCDRDLSFSRPVEQRLVGTCRDAALFLCSMLRHQNIPARIRYGLAPLQLSYMQMIGDHCICEYWDSEQSRWIAIEGEMTQRHLDVHRNKLNINLNDLQYPVFQYAGAAVANMLRNKWDRYMYLDRGLWYYRNLYIRDLAFLNKEEVNIWDHWGIMIKEPNVPSERFIAILEELSSWDQCSFAFTEKARHVLQSEPDLRVPDKVICKCPHHKGQEIVTRK